LGRVPLCSSRWVTTTSTAPAACGGVIAVIDVALTTVTPVAGVSPRFTVAPAWNPVPVMLTAVPPPIGPELGEIAVTVGTELDPDVYVNPSVRLPLCVSGLVTTTSTVAAACAAVVAVIKVAFTTVTPVAAVPPRLTVAPARNPVPVIVTAVPPLVVPEMGDIPVRVGAGLEPPSPLPLNVAICITQLPEPLGAVAL